MEGHVAVRSRRRGRDAASARAKDIVVMTVAETEEPDESADRLVGNLAWHGFRASKQVLHPGDEDRGSNAALRGTGTGRPAGDGRLWPQPHSRVDFSAGLHSRSSRTRRCRSCWRTKPNQIGPMPWMAPCCCSRPPFLAGPSARCRPVAAASSLSRRPATSWAPRPWRRLRRSPA